MDEKKFLLAMGGRTQRLKIVAETLAGMSPMELLIIYIASKTPDIENVEGKIPEETCDRAIAALQEILDHFTRIRNAETNET